MRRGSGEKWYRTFTSKELNKKVKGEECSGGSFTKGLRQGQGRPPKGHKHQSKAGERIGRSLGQKKGCKEQGMGVSSYWDTISMAHKTRIF